VSLSRRRSLLALVGLLALAAALRVPGLRYGLPFPLLSPDEESIVPRAWELVHGGGLDPGWYDYPTLLLELLAPLQLPYDEPTYGAARAVAAAVGIGGVAAAWWLGRSAYGAAAGLLAGAACAVSTVHVVYSHMAVTDVLLTTLVTVSLALLVTGRLEWAGVAAGLAASAKYPGILLALPIVLVGWREWRRLAVAAGGALVAFALTSPFVLVHPGRAWDDVSRVQRLGRAGWLGFEDDPPTPLAFGERLWEALGPFVLVAAAGLALAVWELVLEQHKLRSRARPGRLRQVRSAAPREDLVLEQHKVADLALASFALVWFAQLLPLDAHFDRYVLPLVPVLGALAGRLPRVAPVALALLLVPLAWSVGEVRELTRTDTRVVAHAWIEANVPTDALVAVEPSTPPLTPRETIALELPGPGRPSDENRDLDRLRRRGTDYVLVTGAVADRVVAAAAHYPREAAFYAALDTRAERVLYVAPGGDLGGPWVALYRL
jgi:4-amino-4-deoxy-L-arabinose transferase-like glycosyltransferase